MSEDEKKGEETQKIDLSRDADIERQARLNAISHLISKTGGYQSIGTHLSERKRFFEALTTYPQRALELEAMNRVIEASSRCEQEDSKKEPTPMVGAAVIKDDKILDIAYRGELKPGEHAEFTLLEGKLAGVDVTGATLFTTLEPCTIRNHPKKACADRIIQRGISRVVIGILDPNPDVCGVGQLKLRRAHIQVSHFPHDLVERVEELNKRFSDQFDIDAKLKRFAQGKRVGPNGFRTSLDEDGNLIEWLPDEENLGKEIPLIIRRGDKALNEAYLELWEKIWYRRITFWIAEIREERKRIFGEHDDLLQGAERRVREIEETYGKESLDLSETEWKLLEGRFSALAWIQGSEWHESMDT